MANKSFSMTIAQIRTLHSRSHGFKDDIDLRLEKDPDDGTIKFTIYGVTTVVNPDGSWVTRSGGDMVIDQGECPEWNPDHIVFSAF